MLGQPPQRLVVDRIDAALQIVNADQDPRPVRAPGARVLSFLHLRHQRGDLTVKRRRSLRLRAVKYNVLRRRKLFCGLRKNGLNGTASVLRAGDQQKLLLRKRGEARLHGLLRKTAEDLLRRIFPPVHDLRQHRDRRRAGACPCPAHQPGKPPDLIDAVDLRFPAAGSAVWNSSGGVIIVLPHT